MKKRRIISFIVSMAMLLSSMAALHVTAEDEAAAKQTILSDNWHFVDIAHHGDIVVALAKNDTIGTLQSDTQGRLYYSADGGNTWQATKNQPLASNAQISSNRTSQQQILYWKENNMFVAHGGASTYTSTDGTNWTENTALHWTTNTMLTSSGNCLVFGGQNSANATNDLSTKQFANNKFTLDTTTPDYFSLIVAAKPVDSEGNVPVLIADRYVAYDLKFKYSNPAKGNWSLVKKSQGNVADAMLYDAVYSPRTDQYFAVDGTEKLKVFTAADARPQLVVSEGDKVTGVNANADYVVVGMGSGKFFYNNSTQILNSTNNTWTEIPVMEGMTPADEPIKNIEFLDDGSFVALGTTQIYKGSVEGGYKNINEVVETPTATPTATPVATPTTAPTEEPSETPGVTPIPEETILNAGYNFVDIAHNGDTYVALARQRQADKQFDYNNPKLYYSTNGGLTWTENPLNFADINNNQHPISSNKPSQQQLFWWAENNVFVVHGSAMSYISSDGITWTPAEHLFWSGNNMLVPNGEHIVFGGDKSLNITNIGRNPKDFAATKHTAGTVLWSVIAAKPADKDGNVVIYAGGSNNAFDASVKHNDGGTYTWTDIDKFVAPALPMYPYDMVYAKGADQFLSVDATETLFAAKSSKQFVKLKVKDGANVTGVAVNNDHIVVGMSDGTMYYTKDAELTASTEWTEIPVVEGATKAIEEIRNIELLDDGTFVALSITQIYQGKVRSGYKNIKDDVELPEDPTPSPTPTTKPTDEPTVTDTPTTTDEPTATDVPVPGGYSIKFDDKTYKAIVNAPNGTYAIIFAAYDAEGKLVSVSLEQKEVSKPDTSVFPTSFTTEGAASGKVMLWNSIDGMVPLASDIIPFG